MPYWQLFYHVVWATKDREPLLTPAIEPLVYGWLRAKAVGLGATLFALNGTENHVHLVVAIPPSLAVARFVGQVKAVASVKANRASFGVALYWQAEYSVFSFDAKRLPNYVQYVERQKHHHAAGQLIPVLERTSGADLLIREDSAVYETARDDPAPFDPELPA